MDSVGRESLQNRCLRSIPLFVDGCEGYDGMITDDLYGYLLFP
jgi:hypothetical protein